MATETFQQLVQRFMEPGVLQEVMVLEASLAAIHAGGDDPLNLLSYLQSLDIPIKGLSDLLLVNEVADEEEVSAHPVAEGIALTIASDGAWVLFRP